MALAFIKDLSSVEFLRNGVFIEISHTLDGYRLQSDISIETDYLSDDWTALRTMYFDQYQDKILMDLHKYLERHFLNPIPDIDLAAIAKLSNVAIRVKGEFTEGINTINSATAIVLNGKIPFSEYPDYVFSGGWLTKKREIEAWDTAKLFLYYMHQGATEDITLKAKLYLEDNTTQEEDLLTHAAAVANEIFCLPAGYTQLAIADIETAAAVYKYELFISSASGDSESFSIELIDKPYQGKEFIYKNDFGVYENLLTTGFESLQLDVQNKISKKVLTNDYVAQDGEYMNKPGLSSKAFEVYTGLKYTSDIELLIEALSNSKFYKLDADKYTPCILLNGSTPIYNEKDDMHSLNLKYRLAYDE